MSHISQRSLAVLAVGIASFAGLASNAVADQVVDRSEFSTTTRSASGELTTRAASVPINFRDNDGDWRSVDTALESAGSGKVAAAAVDGEITLPASAGGRIVVEHDGQSVSLKLVGASGGSRTVSDSTASFSNVLPGVSTSYTATARGVKEVVKLDSSAESVLEYDLRGPDAWSAAHDGDDIVLKDAAGTVQFRVAAPLAWDAAEDPAYTNDLGLAVSKVSDGRWTVTLTPDESWINDPARVDPISIDPDVTWEDGTTTIQGTAADTYVASGGQANYTYTHNGFMHTGYYQRWYKGLVKFDLSSIPSTATVTESKLKLFQPVKPTQAQRDHKLRTITSSWNPAEVTWNKRNDTTNWTAAGGDVSSDPTLTSAATPVKDTGWYAWTAPTAAVQGWVDGTLDNYGFQVAAETSPAPTNAYTFATNEASSTSSYPATQAERPILEVTWNEPEPPAGDAWPIDGDVCSVQANGNLNCAAGAVTVGTGSDAGRLAVLKLSRAAARRVALRGEAALRLPANAADDLELQLVRVPLAEVTGGQLSSGTLAALSSASDEPTFEVSSGDRDVISNDVRALQTVGSESGDYAYALRLSDGPASVELCTARAACVTSHDVYSEPWSATGVRAHWTQPTLELPMGGIASLRSPDGAAYVKLYRAPDEVETGCLSLVPEFNSAGRTFGSGLPSFGSKFAANVEQVELFDTPQGRVLHGPTGWVKAVEPEDLAEAAIDTGAGLSYDGDSLVVTGELGTLELAAPATNDSTRPSECRDGADSGLETQLSFDADGIESLETDETALDVTRDGSGRITEVDGALFGTTSYSYSSGKLVEADLGEDGGAVEVSWSTVGGESVPSVFNYSNDESVTLEYAANDPKQVVSIEVRDAEDAVVDAAYFTTIGGERRLTTNDESLPTGETLAAGKVVGPDAAGPVANYADTWSFAPNAYFRAGGGKLSVEGSVTDGASGVRSIVAVDDEDDVVASATSVCSPVLGCPASVALNELPITGAEPYDGQYLPVRLVDAAGNVTLSMIRATEIDSPVPGVLDVRIDEVDTGTATFVWNVARWDYGVVREARHRVNGGPWGAWERVDEGRLGVAAAVGDDVDVEIRASDALGGQATPQAFSREIPIEADAEPDPLPESDVPSAYQGDPETKVTVTVLYRLPDDSTQPAAGIQGAYRAVGGLPGTSDDVQHVGIARAGTDGVLEIPGPIHDGTLRITFDGVTNYDLGYGDEARSVTIEIPWDTDESEGRFAQRLGGGPNKPSIRELKWCFKPFTNRSGLCQLAAGLEMQASRIVENYWDADPSDGGRRNAHRHGYWNALLAYYVSQPGVPWNMDQVRQMVNKHEEATRRGTLDERRHTAMDYWNNHIGRIMGKNRKTWTDRRLCHGVFERAIEATTGLFYSNSTKWVPGLGRYQGKFIYRWDKGRNIYNNNHAGGCGSLHQGGGGAGGVGTSDMGTYNRYFRSGIIASP